MKYASYTLICVAALTSAVADAAETTTYTYDALGRLTKSSQSGTVNAGVEQNYTLDAAGNRTNVSVTGSPFATPIRPIVVPLNGPKVIPIPTGF